MAEYYNPQQEPGFDKRTLLVLAITFILLLVLQPMLMKYFGRKPPAESNPQTAQAPAANPSAPQPAAPMAQAGAVKPLPSAAGTRQATAETETVVENDLYRVTFTNRGAQVKSWVLKKYKDDSGKPLDLVLPAAAQQHGFPLSLWTYDEGLRKRLAEALYTVEVQSTTTSEGAPQRTLSFDYAAEGIVVHKAFTFDLRNWDARQWEDQRGPGYVVTADVQVTQNGAAVQAFPAWAGGFGDQTTPAAYASGMLDWQYLDKVERTALKKVSGGATLRQPMQWAGPSDQYFAAVFLPDQPADAVMVTLRNAIEVPKDPAKPQGDKAKVELPGAAVGLAGGRTTERIFVGPKNLSVVESVRATAVGGNAPDLRQLVNFGFFSFIARPLFLWLRWTQAHMVSNWGWAIVVLTVIINVALLPLRIASMRSALKMQRLQPQMNAIKDKYKAKMRNLKAGDRVSKMELTNQQNQEIAALFKREGANPAGGCLPMLIQMPFLFAFYTMLGSAIELRQAPWLWIRDLSAMDPYHVLPIGIIITTLLVQKMTPQAGVDPTQQKMMTVMMPVMLGVISWSLSSGLGVYWVVGNVIAIAQQMIMNRTRFGQEMRAEAEKRARKKQKVPAKT